MKSLQSRETEVKLRVSDLAALRKRLARVRAKPAASGRVYERNTLYDTPQGGLAKRGQLLRIRLEELSRKPAKAGRHSPHPAILTFKGPAERQQQAPKGKRYKVRDEFEVGVTDPERLRQILEGLGLRGWFHYEKYRTTYRLPAAYPWATGLHLVVDETPIGAFVELEGPRTAIDRAAELLGFTPADYITKSYLALYLEQCRKRGIPPGDMLFHRKKSEV